MNNRGSSIKVLKMPPNSEAINSLIVFEKIMLIDKELYFSFNSGSNQRKLKIYFSQISNETRFISYQISECLIPCLLTEVYV